MMAGPLPLPLPFLLLAGLLRAAPPSEPPTPSACDPEGCYAAFFQRRSFLEAWRGCRELGGNLAALRRPEEAAQVRRLLRSHGGGGGGGEPSEEREAAAEDGGPPRRLLWIGLQRQPRHCFPQRPLRGFTWTTGDQETAYTNWDRPLSAVGAGGCSSSSAPRCAVLEDRGLRWLEGSCTVPVDGYLCRFAFRGMCPGLAAAVAGDQEEAAAAASAAVRYATPFGPAEGRLRFAPLGTVASVGCPGGAAVSVLCQQAEGGGAAWSKAPPLCHPMPPVPSSWCEGDNGGCQQLCLDEGSGYACECHAGYYLLPDGHSCVPATRACLDGEDSYPQCQCPPGYEPGPDGQECQDLDECASGALCDHECENTEGSYLCRCRLGFRPSEDEPGQCVDTDECQFTGVCQQMCVNYVGGFECYCAEGYELDADSISCVLMAQLAPLATPDGPLRRPFEVGHGWPQDPDPPHRRHLGDGTAFSDHYPVFQDIRLGAPEFESPSLFLPDSRVFPRMVPDSEVGTNSQESFSVLVQHNPYPLDFSPTPDPTTSDAPGTPLSSTGIFSPSSPVNDPQNLPEPPTDPRNPKSPDPPSDPSATLLPPLWDLTNFPDPSVGPVVGGVRALLPTLAGLSPTPGEGHSRQKRDDRWPLVALLVPICVFVVIMLALGIVYCTRCGAHTKTRSITRCYRWVVGSAGKGAAPPSRACQPATCRTTV